MRQAIQYLAAWFRILASLPQATVILAQDRSQRVLRAFWGILQASLTCRAQAVGKQTAKKFLGVE